MTPQTLQTGRLDSATAAVKAAPAPPGAAAACDPLAAVSRPQHLFRGSRQSGRVHPLWRLMLMRSAQSPGSADGPASAPTPTPSVPAATLDKLSAAEVRQRVAELPPLPEAAMRALRTLQREQTSLQEVAVELECDASLTARILRLANSPFYGVAGRISSARDAVQLLGRRTLESMLTLAALTGQLQGPRSLSFDSAAFWRHAVATAIVSRRLARGVGADESQAFVAGLLHDIGLLAMSVYFPQSLDALLGQARAADLDLYATERQHDLTPHADVGAWIAAHWNFPAAVVQAIAVHHSPGAPAAGVDNLSACVHVANAVAHALDVAKLAHELVPSIDPLAWQRVALTDEDFLSLFAETEAGVQALCAALAL